jgi:hypothetical protein
VPPPADSAASDKIGLGEAVGLLGGVVFGALLVGGALAVGELLVFTGFEGDLLGAGELSVGVGEDRRWLGVGLADAVVVEVCDAVSRLVPRLLPLFALAGTDAVVGWVDRPADWDGDVVFAVVVEVGDPPMESSTAMMAAIPHTARPMPPIRRVRCLESEPRDRSGS